MLCNYFTFSIIQVLQLTIIWRGVLLDDLIIVFQEEHLGSSQWFFGFLSLLALVSRYPTASYLLTLFTKFTIFRKKIDISQMKQSLMESLFQNNRSEHYLTLFQMKPSNCFQLHVVGGHDDVLQRGEVEAGTSGQVLRCPRPHHHLDPLSGLPDLHSIRSHALLDSGDRHSCLLHQRHSQQSHR